MIRYFIGYKEAGLNSLYVEYDSGNHCPVGVASPGSVVPHINVIIRDEVMANKYDMLAKAESIIREKKYGNLFDGFEKVNVQGEPNFELYRARFKLPEEDNNYSGSVIVPDMTDDVRDSLTIDDVMDMCTNAGIDMDDKEVVSSASGFFWKLIRKDGVK